MAVCAVGMEEVLALAYLTSMMRDILEPGLNHFWVFWVFLVVDFWVLQKQALEYCLQYQPYSPSSEDLEVIFREDCRLRPR
jgi:hypothetical protein